jgi:hypothetical protein
VVSIEVLCYHKDKVFATVADLMRGSFSGAGEGEDVFSWPVKSDEFPWELIRFYG